MKKLGIPTRTISEAMTGRVLSEEHKKNLSGKNNHMYGKKHTEKTKQLLSRALSGENNPNYGMPRTEKTKLKISNATRGEKNHNYGKHLSEETRKKLSEIRSGENHYFYGKHHSEETKLKISKSRTGYSPSQATRQKLSESRKGENNAFYGKRHTEKTKQLMRGENNYMYGRHHTEEEKRAISEAVRGANHPNWQGGKSFEPYGPEFNKALKASIRLRDKRQCRICYKYENGKIHSIHHIDYCKTNNDPNNLITLCKYCHAKTNLNRPYWQEYFTDKHISVINRKIYAQQAGVQCSV